MLTVQVKWMSGDLVELSVPYGSKLYQIIPLLTSDSFYKVTFFKGEKILSHSFSLVENEELCIFIKDAPRIAIVYYSRRDCYREISDPYVEKEYTGQVFDQVYIDYQTYCAFFVGRQEVRDSLYIVEAEHASVQGFVEFCFLLNKVSTTREDRFLWKEFLRLFEFSENIKQIAFPSVVVDKKQLLTPSQWASYCVINTKVKTEVS